MKNAVETVMTQEYWERNYKRKYNRRMRKAYVNTIKRTLICTACVAFFVGMFAYTGNADYYVETGHREYKGTVCDNGVYCENGKAYETETELKAGTKVYVEIDTQYTSETDDDEVVNIRRRLF